MSAYIAVIPTDASNHTLYEARCDAESLESVRNVPFVKRAHYFLPKYKLSPQMRRIVEEMPEKQAQSSR